MCRDEHHNTTTTTNTTVAPNVNTRRKCVSSPGKFLFIDFFTVLTFAYI